MKKKKIILIVGGTGFLGFHICNFLKKKNWSILSLSLGPPLKQRKIKKVKYLFGDISKLKQLSFLINLKVDYVVNCGGYVDHHNEIKTYNTHVKGCKNLYTIFSKKNLRAFIQLGSSAEYGLATSPHTEDKKEKPKDSYGKCKLKATNFFRNLKSNFPYIILRPYQVYGPKQDSNRLIPFIINSCLKNKKFPCSHGNQFRDFLYVDDFVMAVYSSLNNKNCYGEIFNIGYGKPIKTKKIIKKINKKINLGHPEYGKILMRKYEQKKIFPSIKKASKYLNWSPKVNFEKGLNKTIEYYKSFKHSNIN
jgi:UDP-glucose 4-epimerase